MHCTVSKYLNDCYSEIIGYLSLLRDQYNTHITVVQNTDCKLKRRHILCWLSLKSWIMSPMLDSCTYLYESGPIYHDKWYTLFTIKSDRPLLSLHVICPIIITCDRPFILSSDRSGPCIITSDRSIYHYKW